MKQPPIPSALVIGGEGANPPEGRGLRGWVKGEAGEAGGRVENDTRCGGTLLAELGGKGWIG